MNTTTEIKRRPVAKVLRAMKVGDKEVYPIEQYNSIRNYPNSMIPERLEGWKFKVSGDYKTRTVTITRVS